MPFNSTFLERFRGRGESAVISKNKANWLSIWRKSQLMSRDYSPSLNKLKARDTVSLVKGFCSKGKQHPIKCNKKHGKFQNRLRPGISTSMSTSELCLPYIAMQWSVVCYYRSSQLRPRNWTKYFLLSVCLCLAVWLCLKMGSGNMVLMRLLQVGAKDLTVWRGSRMLRYIVFFFW